MADHTKRNDDETPSSPYGPHPRGVDDASGGADSSPFEALSSDERRRAAARPSPQTDPTNPSRQESTGEWTAAEHTSERSQDEPGLTDEDRDDR
jgi:hypothetical protein